MFFQNGEKLANIEKCFLFDIKILFITARRGEKNRGEIEKDKKKGVDLLISSIKHKRTKYTIFSTVIKSVTSNSTEARIAKSTSYFSFH